MSSSDDRSRSGRRKRAAAGAGAGRAVTLREVAEHLQVSPTTVSVVLNRSPVADSIPPETKDRVFAAARELGYRPNYMARSLRRKSSLTVGVLVPDIGEGFSPAVMAGVESHLLQAGYFYLVVSHRWKPDLLEECLELLAARSVDGLLLVNTPITHAPGLPTVAVAGHRAFDGVTNVVIDDERATVLALTHLAELGHRRIAVFKGQPGSGDTETRYEAILAAAAGLGLEIRPDNVVQLSAGESDELLLSKEGYNEGYACGRRLLAQGSDFSALFAFNDVSAIGAVRAFLDAGLRVPEDLSVVGYDDIMSAAFLNPSLTTVRQPMREMGEIAARILLDRVGGSDAYPAEVMVEPELLVRSSTGPASAGWRSAPSREVAAEEVAAVGVLEPGG